MASPLGEKKQFHPGKPTGHARLRHEQLSGSPSPAALDARFPRDFSAADETLRVAPLRLAERKLKRRSSIAEGHIAQLRAQLRGEIPVPPEENIFPPSPTPEPATLQRSAAHINLLSLAGESPHVSSSASPGPSSEYARGRARAAELPSAFPGFERRWTPIQEAVAKDQLSPRSKNPYGASDLPFPQLNMTWSPERSESKKKPGVLARDEPSPLFQQPSLGHARNASSQSAFDLEKKRPTERTLLPRLETSYTRVATKEPDFGVTPTSPYPSLRPRHVPFVVKGFEQPTRDSVPRLTFDPPEEMKQDAQTAVPSPRATTTPTTTTPTTATPTTVTPTMTTPSGHKPSKSEGSSRGTSKTLASFFSWRRNKNPTVPKDPRPPSIAWNPFERTAPQPPSASAWVHGEAVDEDEVDERTAFFRAKASEQASTAKGKEPQAAYSVGTLPRPQQRGRSRPPVTADMFSSAVQRKASKESVKSHPTASHNEDTPPPPPVPRLPDSYRGIQRTDPQQRDPSYNPPTNALEAAAAAAATEASASISQRRTRRFNRQDASYMAVPSESSLRSAFTRSSKKPAPGSTDQK